MNSKQILRLALLPVLALLGTGCSGRYLKSLDATYEHTRLPAHFDKSDDKDDKFLSVGVSQSEQKTIAFRDSSSVYSVRNAGTSVDGSLLVENGALFFGAQVGFTPGNGGLVRAGGFGGASVRVFDRLVTSAEGGLFLNNNMNRAHFDEIEWVWIFPTIREDSSDGAEAHMEIPLRANVLFDTKTPVSPYLSMATNLIGIGVEDAGENLIVTELTAGALLELPGGHGFRIEGSALSQEVANKQPIEGDSHSGPQWSGRVEYVKKI